MRDRIVREANMSEELQKRLEEHLPLDCFRILKHGVAYYFDFIGVSFGEDEAEQIIINAYIARMVAEKAGCAVRVVREHHAGNGHFTVNFELEDKSVTAE